jgi:PAS domain S-box-containing protein
MDSKILIVDDEESICFGFKVHLEKEGYKIQIASNYSEALEALDKNEPDVIIADIILGGFTGIDLLEDMKKNGLSIPVIMITGQPNITTATDSVRLGAFDYLPKPVRKETLLKVVRFACNHKKIVDKKETYRHNLEAIFGSLKDAIISVDENMKVLEANSALRSICGLDPESIIKSDLSECQEKCSGECTQVFRESLKSKRSVKEIRMECRRNDRPHQVVFLSSTPLLLNQGKVRGGLIVIRDATELLSLKYELKKRYRFHNIIGKSSKMQDIFRLIETLKETDTTVLITGESGTGKELLAKALHYESSRSHMPLINVNCSALSEGLLESELFGHAKGAFTGAIREKIGRFQLADGGTLFFDEIGETSPLVQLKLLRVLQEREFEMVGDSTSIRVNVRILAATNRKLKEKVAINEFREDLYYRLRVLEITLPPLRERREDIPLLVNHFVDDFAKKQKKEINGVSEDVMAIFLNHSWPGNIRELENAIEHSIVLCPDKIIAVEHLPNDINVISSTRIKTRLRKSFDSPEIIFQALHDAGWNKAKASRILGISRPTLYRKIREFQLSALSPKV